MKKIAWLLVFLLLLTGVVAGCRKTPPQDDDNSNTIDNGDDNDNDDDNDVGITSTLAALIEGRVVLMDDAGQELFATAFDDATDLLWSPDGNRILMRRLHEQGLWVMNADGTNLQLLDKGVASLDSQNLNGYLWHPGSNMVSYLMAEVAELRTRSLDSSTPEIIPLPEVGNQGPWWNPSGTALTLTLAMDVEPDLVQGENFDPEEDYPDYYNRLHVLIYDSNGSHNFTQHSASQPNWLDNDLIFLRYNIEQISGYLFYEGMFTVKSNGDQLKALPADIFTGAAKTLPLGRKVTIGGDTQIHLVNFDTRAKTLICEQDYYVTYSEFSYPFVYSLASHANWLAALELELDSPSDDEQTGHWDLIVYNLDTLQVGTNIWSKVYELDEWGFNIPHGYENPLAWSADGNWLYVVGGTQNNKEIYKVATNGQGTPQLFLDNCSKIAPRP